MEMEISKWTLKILEDFTRKAYDEEFVDMLDGLSPEHPPPTFPPPICKYGDTPIYSRAQYFLLLNAIFP